MVNENETGGREVVSKDIPCVAALSKLGVSLGLALCRWHMNACAFCHTAGLGFDDELNATNDVKLH